MAAAAPPLGAIPLAFINNQFQYCSVICPHVVQGLVTIPIAVVMTPVTFLGALAATGAPLRALGAAAATVTGAANAAATPIIENDVFRVVPKAFNNLEVAVVELLNVAAAVSRPGEFLQELNSARANILAALNQPLPPPVPTETGARTLPQVLAVEAIRVFAAVAFQAGEILLLGVVQTADAAAQELALSGDPVAAIEAGVAQAAESLTVAGGIVRDAADTALTNISAALADPFPGAAPTGPDAEADNEADTEPDTASVIAETSRVTAVSDVSDESKPKTLAQLRDREDDFGLQDDSPSTAGQASSADSSTSASSASSAARSTRSATPSPVGSSAVRERSADAVPGAGETFMDSATPSAVKNAMNNDPPR
ncbi:hypothetical protein H7I53_23195 [Mycolicibacterium pulveris]|nr:hypothetical protein [Mycolicibacterium pulveris]